MDNNDLLLKIIKKLDVIQIELTEVKQELGKVKVELSEVKQDIRGVKSAQDEQNRVINLLSIRSIKNEASLNQAK